MALGKRIAKVRAGFAIGDEDVQFVERRDFRYELVVHLRMVRQEVGLAAAQHHPPLDRHGVAIGIGNDLAPALVEKIKEAFMTFDFTGTALGEEFEGVSRFVPVTYQENWAVIREIQEANNVQYTPQGLAAE